MAMWLARWPLTARKICSRGREIEPEVELQDSDFPCALCLYTLSQCADVCQFESYWIV